MELLFQLRVWPNLTEDNQKEMINNEESIVYSQAIHYANRMVYLRVPLDASKSFKEQALYGVEGESTSSNITNRYAVHYTTTVYRTIPL